MLHLKTPEQKLIFKILFHLVVIITIIIIAITTTEKRIYEYNSSRESIVMEYEMKMNEKRVENLALLEKTKVLEIKIDSLIKIKQNITISYDQKINSIYSATFADHAKWLDTTINKLSNSKIK